LFARWPAIGGNGRCLGGNGKDIDAGTNIPG
jgi:hypothetical protein